MAILQDCGPKFKSCKIFQLYTNLTRYLTRFLKEKHFLQDLFFKKSKFEKLEVWARPF